MLLEKADYSEIVDTEKLKMILQLLMQIVCSTWYLVIISNYPEVLPRFSDTTKQCLTLSQI